MIEPLTKQEQDYLMQVLLTRPLGEVLPVFLKMTGQELVKVNGAQMPTSAQELGGVSSLNPPPPRLP